MRPMVLLLTLPALFTACAGERSDSAEQAER